VDDLVEREMREVILRREPRAQNALEDPAFGAREDRGAVERKSRRLE